MASSESIASAQPWNKAVAVVFKDGNSISWGDCRLIWDSTSLVSSDDDSSEVTVFRSTITRVLLTSVVTKGSIFEVEGKHTNPEGVYKSFRLQHCFNFGPDERYIVRVCCKSPSGDSNLVEVVYKAGALNGGKRLFEQEVQEMTATVKASQKRWR